MTDLYARMRQLVGTSADWTADDIVIGDGEMAFERVGTSVKWKFGNGTDKFSALPYMGASPDAVIVACSDETTALAVKSGVVTFRMPRAMTLAEVRASLSTAQVGGSTFTVDIKVGGTTVLGTKLTVQNGQKTSVGGVPATITTPAIANDAEITIDITQIGDGTAKGLKVALVGA